MAAAAPITVAVPRGYGQHRRCMLPDTSRSGPLTRVFTTYVDGHEYLVTPDGYVLHRDTATRYVLDVRYRPAGPRLGRRWRWLPPVRPATSTRWWLDRSGQLVTSTTAIDAVTIGYAPSTASRPDPERHDWLLQLSYEGRGVRRPPTVGFTGAKQPSPATVTLMQQVQRDATGPSDVPAAGEQRR